MNVKGKQFELISAVALMTILMVSCTNKPENYDRVLSDTEKEAIGGITSLAVSEGLILLEQNCYSCHNPQSKSHDDMLAPPLAGIKYKYHKAYPERELFVRQMADFVHSPTKENALMKGPVRRFGLMPKTVLSREEIDQVCLFIYDQDLETPSWFPEHFEDQHGKPWSNN